MAKLDWSKAGTYRADPARYQRGDDMMHVNHRGRRREAQKTAEEWQATPPVRDVPKKPKKRYRRVLTPIERCQAHDRRCAQKAAPTPTGARLRAKEKNKLLKRLAKQPASQLANEAQTQKAHKGSSSVARHNPHRQKPHATTMLDQPLSSEERLVLNQRWRDALLK